MKLLTFHTDTLPAQAGILTHRGIVSVKDLAHYQKDTTCPLQVLELLYEDRLSQLNEWLAELPDEVQTHSEADVTLLSPVIGSGAMLDFYTFEQHVKTCRAKRGLDVIDEWYQYPVYYNGNPRAFQGHGSRVHFPPKEDRRDYELELAIVIGKEGRDIPEDQAHDYIAGYTIMNDWSARSIQRETMKVGLGPSKGKDFATSLGPYLVTPEEVLDPRNLTMVARVNGEEWSRGNSGSSHYTFSQMIAFASEGVTLYPGDVLGSGTVGTGCGLELDKFLNPGDVVELEIEHLGVLRNTVA